MYKHHVCHVWWQVHVWYRVSSRLSSQSRLGTVHGARVYFGVYLLCSMQLLRVSDAEIQQLNVRRVTRVYLRQCVHCQRRADVVCVSRRRRVRVHVFG